ncbi:MAG: hypothetical protein QXD23_00350 [Candidatus Micrarchaeaceae archaeon]
MSLNSNYISEMKTLLQSLFPAVCNNCASKILIPNNLGICTVCELVVIKEGNNSQANLFEKITPLINKDSVTQAYTALNALSKESTTPSISYVFGIFYSILSDYAYTNLNYNGKGFMEENSANKYLSLDLTSKSKEFFFRTLKQISKIEQKGSDIIYLEFITNIKLKRMFYALNSLKVLNQNKTGEIYNNYANMVYAVESKRKDAEYFVKPLLNTSPILFFYISKILAQKKNLKEAIKILEYINSNVNIPTSYAYFKKLESILTAAGFD